jgi:glutaconate CoA-transferase subunit A
MKAYLDRYVYGPASWMEFLELIGMDEVQEAVGRARDLQND